MRYSKLIFTGLTLSFSTQASFFISDTLNDEGKADSLQVMVIPGKTPTTYNPKTGELKEIKVK